MPFLLSHLPAEVNFLPSNTSMLKDKTHLFSWKDLTIQVQISHPHPFKVQILHLWAWRTVKCLWVASGGVGGELIKPLIDWCITLIQFKHAQAIETNWKIVRGFLLSREIENC